MNAKMDGKSAIDYDMFVRHFVYKSVQVIVQSRLGEQRIATQSKPTGNDWFNLAVYDIKDINEQTIKCLDSIVSESEHKKSALNLYDFDWKVCCEISVKTNDGNSMIVENWFFSNEAYDYANTNTTNEVNIGHQWSTNVSSNGSNGPPNSVFYNIYNRMSLMLKSLISLTRATPVFRLSRGQSAHSYVICYRVYRVSDIKTENESQFFSPIIQLGSIKSVYNELYASFAYRTDLTFSTNSNVNDNTVLISKSPQLMPLKSDHFKREERLKNADERDVSKPLMPAFASTNTDTESLALLPDVPFTKLLLIDDKNDSKKEIIELSSKVTPKSDPIVIPSKNKIDNSFASSPVYSSSGDSFVFVELKAPFAPEEHNELNSFFNGPSPTFKGSGDETNADLNELTVQLAELESNAQLFDSFVESICLTDNEDIKTEI